MNNKVIAVLQLFLLVVWTLSVCLGVFDVKTSHTTHNSFIIADIKAKGIVLKKDMSNFGATVELTIQTPDDVVTVKTTTQIYNLVSEGDTIK